jgi:hypothetical protein
LEREEKVGGNLVGLEVESVRWRNVMVVQFVLIEAFSLRFVDLKLPMKSEIP